MMIEPRPYQTAAAQSFDAFVKDGGKRGIINLPTGTGKTVLGALMARRRGRTLWLAHRDELIRQPARTFRIVHPGAEVGIVKADRDEWGARDVVIASVPTVARPKRLRRLMAGPPYDLVVVDEAHHAVAPTWKRVIDRLNGTPTLGLTATVERADGSALGQVWQRVVYRLPLLKAIRDGWLVDVRSRRVRLQVNLGDVGERAGDFVVSQLDAALLRAKVAEEVAEAYAAHAGDRKGLVFTVSIEAARQTARALRAKGIAAVHLSGETSMDLRRRILYQLKTGETQVVTNCAVLTEGFDEPSIGCIGIARPTKSRALYLQMIGRGLRLHEDKDDCLVLDVAGATDEHNLMQAPSLLGATPAQRRRAQEEGLRLADLLAPFGPNEEWEYEAHETLIRQSRWRPRQNAIHLQWNDGWGRRLADVGYNYTVEMQRAGPDEWQVIGRAPDGTVEQLTVVPVWDELAHGIAMDYARRVRVIEEGRQSAQSAP